MAANLGFSEAIAALELTGEKRKMALDALAAPDTPERTVLDKLASAADAKLTTEHDVAQYVDPTKIPMEVLEKHVKARAAYNAAIDELKTYNVDVAEIAELGRKSDASSPEGTKAQANLNAIAGMPEHSAKKVLIQRLAAASAILARIPNSNLDDPDELERLLQGSGKIDFRIAVERLDETAVPGIEQSRMNLATKGPLKSPGSEKSIAWFEIDPNISKDLATNPNFITAYWGAQNYILLYTDRTHVMPHDATHDWKILYPLASKDEDMREVCDFQFDANGRRYFSELTAANVKHYLAICLDNKVLSVPVISSAITGGACQMAMGTGDPRQIHRNVETLVQILDAGMVPVPLKMISKKTITATP